MISNTCIPIGGIECRIAADFSLKFGGVDSQKHSQNGRPFLTVDIHTIERNELDRPPKKTLWLEIVKKMMIQPVLGSHMQVIPVKYIDATNPILEPFLVSAQDLFDSPILRSQAIQAAVSRRLSHPALITLAIHRFFVEIRDYKECRMELYLASGLRNLLSQEFGECSLRLITAVLFPKLNSAVIHSSAILHHGQVAVFLAPDEGGKTTIALSVPTEMVLCDDFNVLRKVKSAYEIHASPWGKIANICAHGTLGGFFLLKKGSRFQLDKLQVRDIVSYLWMEHRHYFFQLPKVIKLSLFDLLTDACKSVPLYRLTFAKDQVDWKKIFKAM